MYLVNSFKTPDKIKLKGTAKPPFGPEFSLEQVNQADKMELWGTSFGDGGPDFCEYRLIKENQIISTKRVDGY